MAASKAACGVLRGFAGKRTFSLLSDNTNRYAIQSRTYASVIQHAVDKIGPIEVDGTYVRTTKTPPDRRTEDVKLDTDNTLSHKHRVSVS